MKIDGLDLAYLLEKMIWSATYHRDLANAYHLKADNAYADREIVAGEAYLGAWTRERMLMLASTYAIRSAIAHRTQAERSFARYAVARGLAVFVQVACSAETCDDCERPMWQHISRQNGHRNPDILCPFGRDYWALANAIWDANGAIHDRDASGLRNIIARRP